MLSMQKVESGRYNISRILGVMVKLSCLICIVLGCSRHALSAIQDPVDDSKIDQTGMRLAPIGLRTYTGGSVDYLLEHDRYAGRKFTRQQFGLILNAGIQLQSYIWQPWIAQVGADLDGKATLSTTDLAVDNQHMRRSYHRIGRTISGGMGLKLLPRSRLPFSARFRRADDRSEMGGGKSSYGALTDSLDLTQDLTNRWNSAKFNGAYHRLRKEDYLANVDHDETINLRFILAPTRAQIMEINSIRSGGDRSVNNSTYNSKNLTARHVYRAGGVFSLATLASKFNMNNSLDGTVSGLDNLQFSSAGTWRPTTELTVTGGVRLFENQYTVANKSLPVNSVSGANLGANYALYKWLRLYGSVSVMDSNGAQSVTSTALSNLSVSAQHQAKAIKLGEFDYTRFVRATLANNTSSVRNQANNSSTSTTYQSYSLLFQHGLSHNTQLRSGRLNSRIDQTLTNSGRSQSLPATSVLHTGTLKWQRSLTSIRLSANDKRSSNGNRPYFQSINLQASQAERLADGGGLSGNLTVNRQRQGYDQGISKITDSLTATAGLTYAHTRFLDVPKLTFSSSLTVVSADLLQSNYMNQNSQNQGRYAWDNRMGYRVGKLTTELKGIVEEVQTSRHVGLMFHVRRDL